jgi:hypothetical protein
MKVHWSCSLSSGYFPHFLRCVPLSNTEHSVIRLRCVKYPPCWLQVAIVLSYRPHSQLEWPMFLSLNSSRRQLGLPIRSQSDSWSRTSLNETKADVSNCPGQLKKYLLSPNPPTCYHHRRVRGSRASHSGLIDTEPENGSLSTALYGLRCVYPTFLVTFALTYRLLPSSNGAL